MFLFASLYLVPGTGFIIKWGGGSTLIKKKERRKVWKKEVSEMGKERETYYPVVRFVSMIVWSQSHGFFLGCNVSHHRTKSQLQRILNSADN